MARRAPLLLLIVVFVCAGAVGAPAGKGSSESPAKDDYYELYKGLVDTVDQVERYYVKEIDRRELIEAAIQGIFSKLDPYSSYIPPAELLRFRSTVESECSSIGIEVSVQRGQLKVISAPPGTPAYRAGVLAGDRILEINGKSTKGIVRDKAVDQLNGEKGTTVTLTIVHPGRGKKETIPVARQRIHIETVLSDHRKADDSWDFMLAPEGRVGYLRVTAFSRDTAAEMRAALQQLQRQDMRALILDLRFNPGGLLSSAIEVSNLFVSAGTIVSTRGRNSPERVWEAHKEGVFEGFPMVLLVNRYSASASEIVAACLQDHRRAIIVGERTWGKGSVQNVIELEDSHAALKLTTAAYRRPSGKNIHRFEDAKETDEWGVMPDEGFQLKLSDSETMALVEDRKARDIARPKAVEPQKDAASQKSPASQKSAADPSPAKPAGAEEPAEPAFVDRQLEMAVKYLRDQIRDKR